MKPKHVLVLAFALYGLFTVVEDVSAQGTAFTYQGHLNSSGSPANGNYDFTFALFNNNSTNNGQVGSTLTNLDVGVTNGLFTTTLNFGSAFGGNPTWLAISVRTSGVGSYVALSPLQAITPTPYAMYAPSAGAASSVIPNSVTANQFNTPAAPTNGEVLAFINGSLVWTNLAIITSSCNITGNADTTRLNWFYNAMNPYVNPGAVPIMLIGDSTMNSSQGAIQTGLGSGLGQYMAFGGGLGTYSGLYYGGPYSSSYCYNLVSPAVIPSPAPDTNWFARYWTIPAGGYLTNCLWAIVNGTWSMTVMSNVDTIQVVYIVGPYESTNFTVYTSPSYGGPLTAIATLNAYSNIYGGCVTNIPVSGNLLTVVGCSNGAVKLIEASAVTLHQHDFLFYDFSCGGQKELAWQAVLPSIFTNIMNRLNPALILFQNKNNGVAELQSGYTLGPPGYTNSTFVPNYSNFIAWFSNACHQADQIHIGTYPTYYGYVYTNGANVYTNVAIYDDQGMNAVIRQACTNAGMFYIDLYDNMPNSNQIAQLGWYEDGIHLQPTCIREGGYIWSEMLPQLAGINWANTNYFK
jgi:hypothetical protein